MVVCSTIRYAVSLHQHHDMPLAKAYATAVSQFRALRIEQEIAAKTGAMEAEAYGASFAPSEIEREFTREGAALASWTRQAGELDEGEIAARKKWRAIVERTTGAGPWTRGEEYTRLWRTGVRPDYAPALTQPADAPVPATAAPAQSSAQALLQTDLIERAHYRS
jgi:small subunit ribosomal protein S23